MTNLEPNEGECNTYRYLRETVHVVPEDKYLALWAWMKRKLKINELSVQLKLVNPKERDGTTD